MFLLTASATQNCAPGGIIGQQQGIPQLSVSQQPQYSHVPGPGMQTVTSLPPTFQQVLPTSSVVLPANSLPASLTSMPPPTLVSQAPAQGMVSSANAGGLVIPVSYSTSLNPVPMVTSLSTTPLLSVGSGPPPHSTPPGQLDASGGLLPNATLPPPILQVSTAPGMNQYAATTNDPFLTNTNLAGGQPTQVIVGQQALTPVGMSLAGGTPQMAPQFASPVPNSIAPPINTLQPGVQFVSQQQIPAAGQPPPPPAYYGQFTGTASLPMSLPATATYTVTPTTYAIATSGYAYNMGPPKDDAGQPPPPPPQQAPPSQSPVPPPQQPPKRRFTEEKPEEKVPENLLGYQHGPPHLANMIASGPPPSVVSSQQQCPVSQSFSQPVVTVTQTTQGYDDFRTQGFPNPPPVNQPAFVTPPPPPPPSHSPSPERSEVDKHLMPPPPPPGSKRSSQHQSASESQEQRKKMKGALGSVAVYGSDDEEDDSSSPNRQQQQRAAPFNQPGSSNSNFVQQNQPSPPPPSSLSTNHFDQYLQGQIPTTSPQQHQPQQQPPLTPHGQYSPPDPNNPVPYQSCSSPTNFAAKQPAQQQQPQSTNPRNSYEQILSSQPSQFGMPRPLGQSTFTTTSMPTSQAYLPQQQQQPQPPQFNGHAPAVATNPGYLQQFASQPPPSQQFSNQPSTAQPPPFQPPPPGMSFWMSPT